MRHSLELYSASFFDFILSVAFRAIHLLIEFDYDLV